MPTPRLTVCVVDDEEAIRLSLSRLFAQAGHETFVAATGAEAVEIAERNAPDVILLDLVLPDMDGIEVLRRVRSLHNRTAVVMISAHGSIEKAVLATKEGAENFVTKPIDIRKLEALVETIGKCVRVEREVEYYRDRCATKRPFVGVSSHAQKTLQLIDLLAENSDTTVLLSGESGTGKGVVAALIHDRSRRRERPFVEVSCAELTHSLLESELFGHERGAFTDAKQLKKGLVEVANGGTLFLDEVGELDLALQPKLLKILEGRTFRRVGGVRDISVDIRVIAATNIDIEQRVADGGFREDLYYRLKVMPLKLLPLRERSEDIGPLTDFFVTENSRSVGRKVQGVDESAMACLRSYRWPGNIRELKNVLERAMILARGNMITPNELPAEILGDKRSPAEGPLMTLEGMERELIAKTLAASQANRTKTAQTLGISRSTLIEKMRRYGLT